MMQFHVKNELANWHGMCCVSRGFAPVAFSVVAEMCVTGLIALCLYAQTYFSAKLTYCETNFFVK